MDDDDIFMDLEAIVSGIQAFATRITSTMAELGMPIISAGMGPWMKGNFHPSFQPSIDLNRPQLDVRKQTQDPYRSRLRRTTIFWASGRTLRQYA
jgi:hypothetical protein